MEDYDYYDYFGEGYSVPDSTEGYGGRVPVESLGDSFGFDIPASYYTDMFSSYGNVPSDIAMWGLDVGLPGNYVTADELNTMFGNYPEPTATPTDADYPDPQNQEGGFYGNIPGKAEFDPRTNSTILYNDDGSIRDIIVHDERIYDAENQEGGFYGNTPNATYDPSTNKTTIRDENGNITKVIQGPPIVTPPPTTTPPPPPAPPPGPKTPPPGPGPGGSKVDPLLAAILGGLLGLLSKGQGKPAPPGYQGGIPKFTAQRRPGQGTRLIQAAGGGLMDLAAGGTARYLRGGTDGMADKIQTSIDGKQPARLSHGEFVIPADVVSHLGNGNSEAGADVLYDMMAKVRKARTGTKKQGKQINPRKYTPV